MNNEKNQSYTQNNLSFDGSTKKILTGYYNLCSDYRVDNYQIRGTVQNYDPQEIHTIKEIPIKDNIAVNFLLNSSNIGREINCKNLLSKTSSIGKYIFNILLKYEVKKTPIPQKNINELPEFLDLSLYDSHLRVDSLFMETLFSQYPLSNISNSDNKKINNRIKKYCEEFCFPMLPTFSVFEYDDKIYWSCFRNHFIYLAVIIYISYELIQAFSNIYSYCDFGIKFNAINVKKFEYSLDDILIKESTETIQSFLWFLRAHVEEPFCVGKRKQPSEINSKQTSYEQFYKIYGFDIQLALLNFLQVFNGIENKIIYLFYKDKLNTSLENNKPNFYISEYHNSLFSICWSELKYWLVPKEEEKTAIKCQRCNRIFSSQSNSTKYCPNCSSLVHNEKSANSYNKLKVLFEEFKNLYDTIPADKKSTLLKDYPDMELFNKPNISEFKKLKYKNKIEKLELYIEALKNIINVTK